MKNSWKVGLCMVGIVVMTICSSANALTITPSGPGLVLWGDETDQSAINTILANYLPNGVTELYKSDVNERVPPYNPIESGPLAGSYETTFDNEPLDPEEALIEYTGGPIVNDAFLLVKDGNQSPAWYLFNLSLNSSPLPWDGMEDLDLQGFWSGQGAISHVSLYGNAAPAPIPEPAIMLLFGTGLVGLAGVVRRRNKN